MALTAAQKNAALRAISGVNADARKISESFSMPPMGGAADTHLLAPAGQGLRPFAPGEYVSNPDGSWSSERSMTVPASGGRWEVIPSVYLRDGKPIEAANEDDAVRLARESGKRYRSFPSLKAAEDFSIQRENEWQKFERPEDATVIAPLYEDRKGAPMRPPNHVRDRTYQIIADSKMDPVAKTAALKQLGGLGAISAADTAAIAAPVVQMPQSTMSLPDAPSSGGAFSQALRAQPYPTAATAGQAAGLGAVTAADAATLAGATPQPPTAAFPNVTPPPTAAFPDATPPGLGEEIDRRRAMALASLGTPTQGLPPPTMY